MQKETTVQFGFKTLIIAPPKSELTLIMWHYHY